MKKYIVGISIVKTLEVEAADEKEAESIARKMHDKESPKLIEESDLYINSVDEDLEV